MQVHDATRCELGEGPLWHPERQELFWFDIYGRRLHGRERVWDLDGMGSAAGWIDRDRLLILTETGLWVLDLRDGAQSQVAAVEADDPGTRGNDGGTDPWGGFWFGTMGRNGETGAGRLYRWYRGELRQIRDGMSVPNAMTFDPARGRAYVSDTPQHVIWAYGMDADGWPTDPQVFVRDETLMPDGGTVDAEGRLWSAQFGQGRVLCFDAEGAVVATERLPTPQASCPRFGGADLGTLFITTGQENMDAEERAAQPQAGMTFSTRVSLGGRAVQGVAPPPVRMD